MSKALLIIDMINNLDFPQGEELLKEALPVAENIVRIKKMFVEKKLPIIYVNDNFGKWKSNWEEVFDHCSADESRGKVLAELLRPQKEDYFILKPKHSGFYCSNLDVLLNDLKVKELVITGIAGNICVLFTVNDAYMRGYDLHVPENAIASSSKKLNDFALEQFKDVFSIKTESLDHSHQI
ncbi:MAG TPA: isochorismatase family cysteine hydrolase [Bacteriovoracaceae bacterium]|nr:isochorismatase family cysteine hydrolase [Bacteriovoracaceae bacterium]